ncbi:heavy-metal-associated domain-containing protein [Aeromicrobium sp.]|uniref:heavy-metal-associated domain-containing protein n=1 Tax=Aeromicrobium sp. TaxID=1871063 RepID=UPI00199B2DA9|nr:heavy-metal-associated domain-containing protein [Aeromicrobium sp.]MBC7630520.1 heavy-metal-associated domain-containing protein [Aeromicrobium sp.]
MTTETYRIVGMTCEHCVAAVTEEIRALDGVTRVDIDLVVGETSTATVDSSTPLDAARVSGAIEEAGYAMATAADLPPV